MPAIAADVPIMQTDPAEAAAGPVQLSVKRDQVFAAWRADRFAGGDEGADQVRIARHRSRPGNRAGKTGNDFRKIPPDRRLGHPPAQRNRAGPGDLEGTDFVARRHDGRAKRRRRRRLLLDHSAAEDSTGYKGCSGESRWRELVQSPIPGAPTLAGFQRAPEAAKRGRNRPVRRRYSSYAGPCKRSEIALLRRPIQTTKAANGERPPTA